MDTWAAWEHVSRAVEHAIPAPAVTDAGPGSQREHDGPGAPGPGPSQVLPAVGTVGCRHQDGMCTGG